MGVMHEGSTMGFGRLAVSASKTVPLLRQPRELLLPVVEASVDPVLEVGGPGNFQPFLLFPEHGGKICRSHRETGKKRKKTTFYTLL